MVAAATRTGGGCGVGRRRGYLPGAHLLLTTTCDPQRNTRRLLSPLALESTLGVRLPSNLVIFNNKMGAATLLSLRMVG